MFYSRIEPDRPEKARSYSILCNTIQAVGTDAFPECLEQLITDSFGIREFHIFQISSDLTHPRTLFSKSVDDTSADRARAYCAGYFRDDPIFNALTPDTPDGIYAIRVPVREIRNPVFRQTCYGRPGFSEKLALAQKNGRSILVLSIFAREIDGGFDPARVAELCQIGNLLLPIICLHCRLIGNTERPQKVSVSEMEDCVTWAFPELTKREISVCARSILGITSEGIALDLGIKQTSVLTYRRRAYARLNVNSINQLSTMLIQSSAARQLAAAS